MYTYVYMYVYMYLAAVAVEKPILSVEKIKFSVEKIIFSTATAASLPPYAFSKVCVVSLDIGTHSKTLCICI